ncbi:hypothetical protein KKG71_05780 [Patescibacteria group bacterium]|nr:hypothetical protein [Patescibacteria group bacterium]
MSNPLLQDKKVLFNPRGAWKILPNFNAEAQRAEANINQYPIWLHLLDKLRTHFRENPDDEL